MNLPARALEVMASFGVRPFQDYPVRWRVSSDVIDCFWDLTLAPDIDRSTWTGVDLLFGYPVESDATLPPNSMLLERK